MAKSHIDSETAWSNFLTKIERVRDNIGCGESSIYEAWFRGHTNSKTYTLLPSLFRHFKNPDTSNWNQIWQTESDLFYEFAARARELHGLMDDDWDILFAMQHYGTPTRLLDWTEVLGVAIYFAILGVDETIFAGKSGKQNPPPCVWILNPYKLNSYSTGKRNADLWNPVNLGWDKKEKTYYTYGELLLESGMYFDYPRAIYPRQKNQRLHAQAGWFTIHGDKFIPMEQMNDYEPFLQKVELPFAAISSARRFLKQAGITHYSLFADLESLSLHLREKNGLLSKEQAAAVARRRLENRQGPSVS